MYIAIVWSSWLHHICGYITLFQGNLTLFSQPSRLGFQSTVWFVADSLYILSSRPRRLSPTTSACCSPIYVYCSVLLCAAMCRFTFCLPSLPPFPSPTRSDAQPTCCCQTVFSYAMLDNWKKEWGGKTKKQRWYKVCPRRETRCQCVCCQIRLCIRVRALCLKN